jgi:hypothetical protein
MLLIKSKSNSRAFIMEQSSTIEVVDYKLIEKSEKLGQKQHAFL